MQRKKHSGEFKTKVVLEVLKEEKTINEIGSLHQINPNLISRWKAEFMERMPKVFEKDSSELVKLTKSYEATIDELYTQIGKLTAQIEWLKKNLADEYSHKERRHMALADTEMSMKEKCELLTISRASIYYQPASPSEEELTIKRCIDKIYTSCPMYGYRRMCVVLNNKYQLKVGSERVRRYMNEMGIEAVYPRQFTSTPNPAHKVYPYLLKGLRINRANLVWGIDITYITLQKGFMYLVAIIDWYTRYVVSYELSDTLEIGFVLSTCKQALKQTTPTIMNSDQGSHFTSPKYTELFLSKGVKISMDHRGRAYDNIFTERLWRSVKYENIYLNEYETPRQLRLGLNEYFAFYNYERPHQSLNYQTPAHVYTGNFTDIPEIMIKH